jgi:hypothetical protein
VITPGKNLTVLGSTQILTNTVVDGGILTVGELPDTHLLELRRGTFNITAMNATVGPGGTFTSLDVAEQMTVNVTLGVTNTGLVTGDGQLGGTFTNAVGGELRAQPGRSLMLTGAANVNSGQIRLLGGELTFTQDLTNNAAGVISGNGSLIAAGGLTNIGTMNFANATNIVGSIDNVGGGKIISAGGGATVFYDDVTNNGEIRTSTNAFTVFFGNVSGTGTFTGTGTVNFEGGLSPGSSPAAVQFAGNVALGADSTLAVELGGASPGTEYDQINVAGQLALDGILEVSLIDGFMPVAGQTFDVINAGSTSGAFSSVVLPDGISWDLSQLSVGILRVVSIGLPGDFNQNGIVDAADYVVWRKNDGTLDAYDEWQASFGEPGGSGSGSSAKATAPEPATLVLLMIAAAGCCLRRAPSHIESPNKSLSARWPKCPPEKHGCNCMQP